MHIVPVENLFVSFMLLNNTFLNTTDLPNLFLPDIANITNRGSQIINKNNQQKKFTTNVVIPSINSTQPQNQQVLSVVNGEHSSENRSNTTFGNVPITSTTFPEQKVSSTAQVSLNHQPQLIVDMNTPPAFMLKSYNIQRDSNHTEVSGRPNRTEDGLTNFTLIQEIICFPKKKVHPGDLKSGNGSFGIPASYRQFDNNGIMQTQLQNRRPIYHQNVVVRPVPKTTQGYKSTGQNKNSGPLLIHVFQKSKALRHEDISRNPLDMNKLQQFNLEENRIPSLPIIPLPDLIEDGESILDTIQTSLKARLNEAKAPYLNVDKPKTETHFKFIAPSIARFTRTSRKQLMPEFPDQNSYPFGYKTIPNSNKPLAGYNALHMRGRSPHLYNQYPITNWSQNTTHLK